MRSCFLGREIMGASLSTQYSDRPPHHSHGLRVIFSIPWSVNVRIPLLVFARSCEQTGNPTLFLS